ncbi:GntR family transcriptional regulator [Streptomyces sp. NPDC054933]
MAADIRAEIMSGDLAPGSSLPSTTQLKERFAASSATVQKALGLLKDEGLVVGRPGAAVTVREHRQLTIRPAAYLVPAASGEPYPWVAEASARGARGHSQVLEVGETVPPADITEALRLPTGGTALLRAQVLYLEDEPVELVHSYYPLDIARGTEMMARRRIKGGTPALLASRGYPPRRTVDKVSARVPTQEQYTLLRLPGNLPVLRTLRVVYSDHERPIEATILAKAGHLYEVQYEIEPQ